MSESGMAAEPETLEDVIRQDLTQSDATAAAFLRQSWVSRAITALWEMRRTAGLTQTEVADRMGTKQSVVARWERGDEGGISLRRYVDFALACGALPMDIEFRPLEMVRTFAVEYPDRQRTSLAYDMWAAMTGTSGIHPGAHEGLWDAPSQIMAASIAEEPCGSELSELVSYQGPALQASVWWTTSEGTVLGQQGDLSAQAMVNPQTVA